MPQDVQKIIQEAQSEWMDIEAVVSVGQGRLDDRDCIAVYVTGESPEITRKIPSEYKGIPVDIREGGNIRAQ